MSSSDYELMTCARARMSPLSRAHHVCTSSTIAGALEIAGLECSRMNVNLDHTFVILLYLCLSRSLASIAEESIAGYEPKSLRSCARLAMLIIRESSCTMRELDEVDVEPDGNSADV